MGVTRELTDEQRDMLDHHVGHCSCRAMGLLDTMTETISWRAFLLIFLLGVVVGIVIGYVLP